MQKKLIALAVAGLVSAPAFAQSNVTIYGVVDAALAYGKADDEKYTGLANGVLSGNRLGFKGTEDLGNGLKAVFVLEQGFNIGDGSPSSTKQFHRQAWAGLQGGFGTVGLGRQYAPGYNYTAKFSAVSAGTFDVQSILSLKGGMTITPNSPARWDNSVTYNLGNMGGLMAEAIYSFNGRMEADTGLEDDDMFGLGVGYAAGPFGVGLVYHRINDISGGDDDTDEIYLGGSYDLGVAKLFASYQKAENDNTIDGELIYLGGIVPVGKGNVHLALGQLKSDVSDDADSKSLTLGYTHSLSKRTTAYVIVNRTDNDDRAVSTGEPLADVGFNPVTGAAAEDSTAFAVGMRHTF